MASKHARAAKNEGIDPVDPLVTERFYDREVSGREKLFALLRKQLLSALGLAGIAGLFLPLQIFGIVTLDLPLALFDALAPNEGLAVSRWMSRGEGAFMLLVLLTLLMTRRWGSERVGRAVLLSWAMSMGVLTILIVELAPELNAGDYPSGRFMGVLMVSWFAAQLTANWIYDMTRGGAWWRAPFFAAAIGFAVQSVLYFPGAFVGTSAPWPWWMAVNLLLSTLIAGIFVVVYRPLRFLIRPREGLGGR